jgi:hypothetical protein
MEDKIEQIIKIVYALHGNKHLDYISNQLSMQAPVKSTNMRKIFFEFYTHLQEVIHEVNDFSIEITRCSCLVKHVRGISFNRTQFYASKFDTVVFEMGKKVKFLDHYVEML